jgi:hypothetical protein
MLCGGIATAGLSCEAGPTPCAFNAALRCTWGSLSQAPLCDAFLAATTENGWLYLSAVLHTACIDGYQPATTEVHRHAHDI